MLTIFTIPKPFKNPHINIIQKNAIQSWLKLHPQCEVILFGEDQGVAEIAEEFKVRHIRKIKKNEFGTPLLNSVFALAKKVAKYKLLTYINADIILMDDFIARVNVVKFPKFVIAGRRWNIEIKKPILFSDPYWQDKLRQQIVKKGKLCRYTGIDYFVFPKDITLNMPEFAVGRVGWDNWFLYRMHTLNIPLIDATQTIIAVHQKHNYTHCPGGERGISFGKEAQQNLRLVGGISYAYSLRNANFLLTQKGLKPNKQFALLRLAMQYLGALPFFYPRLEKLCAIFLFPCRVIMLWLRKKEQGLLKRQLIPQ